MTATKPESTPLASKSSLSFSQPTAHATSSSNAESLYTETGVLFVPATQAPQFGTTSGLTYLQA